MLGSESVEPLFVTFEISSSLDRFDWALSQVRKNQKVTRKSWNNKRFFQLKQPNGPIEEVWLNGQSVPLELEAVRIEDILAEDWVLFDPRPSDPNTREEWAAARELQRRMDVAEAKAEEEEEARRNQY